MPDPFQSSADAVLSPSRSAFTVVPSDTTDFLSDAGQVVPKALYIGSSGTLVVRLVDDATTVTFQGLQAGVILPIRPRRVLATGTTLAAGTIIALD
jgi:hypothetical protein